MFSLAAVESDDAFAGLTDDWPEFGHGTAGGFFIAGAAWAVGILSLEPRAAGVGLAIGCRGAILLHAAHLFHEWAEKVFTKELLEIEPWEQLFHLLAHFFSGVAGLRARLARLARWGLVARGRGIVIRHSLDATPFTRGFSLVVHAFLKVFEGAVELLALIIVEGGAESFEEAAQSFAAALVLDRAGRGLGCKRGEGGADGEQGGAEQAGAKK